MSVWSVAGEVVSCSDAAFSPEIGVDSEVVSEASDVRAGSELIKWRSEGNGCYVEATSGHLDLVKDTGFVVVISISVDV